MVHLTITSVTFEKLIVAQLLENVPILLCNLKVHYRVYKNHALEVSMKYFQVLY
jgi:predicted Zn-dependent protease